MKGNALSKRPIKKMEIPLLKVFKNNDLNYSIENIKPQYNLGKKLIYKYDNELSFWGGNEYLYFENKFVRNTNIKIRGFDLNEIYIVPALRAYIEESRSLGF